MAAVEITKEEAIVALRDQSFMESTGATTCGHTGCEDHPVTTPIVHCFVGGFGPDWPLDDAIAEVEKAAKVGWIEGYLGHELAVLTAEGKVWRFEVHKPADAPGGAS